MTSGMTYAQTALTDADIANAYSAKTYAKRVTCHDPSIVMDAYTKGTATNPRYYIYGSHLGRGYTTAADSYQSWSSFAAGEESTGTANSLFANTSGTLVNYSNAYNTHAITKVKNYKGEEVAFGNFNAHSWQYSTDKVQGNQWAADIIYNTTMKKWCMYMSINGDHWCSSIVCLTSDSPEGPWVYQGPVVFSGFQGSYKHVDYAATDDWKQTDLDIATGVTSLPARYKVSSSWGDYWPNCIDPCVFYDEQGKLWMAYGSWSGGIFILELDETTGLRDYTVTYPYQVNGVTTSSGTASKNCTSDPYFGKKIGGGYYCSGEASYIQHIGNYYYLWITNGGLAAAGGYQMRVYRSENPDGPYLDPWGLDARPGKYLMNYGSTAGRDYGVKLFGNYQWDTMPVAELAQGHNSACVDHLGHGLLVNHVRFNDGTEGHQVRVHQLFQTQDGWLVASPYEYDNSTAVTDATIATTPFSTSEICGEYQFMIHKFRQNTANKEYATPCNITLNADGTITGDYNGTWSCPSGTAYIDIKLEKVLGTSVSATFHGVLAKQIIDYTNIPALIFTACGTQKSETTQASNGSVLTTSGLCIWGSKADAKGAIKYTLDSNYIPSKTNADLTLSSGALGAKAVWSSSNHNVMTDDGKIVSNGTTNITVTITKDGYTYTKTYAVTVDTNAAAEYYPVSTNKNTTAAWWSNFSTQDYILKADGTAKFSFYNYSSKAANYKNWCLYGASATHGASGYTEYFGIRCDNWDNTTGSNTGCSSDFNWNTFTSDMDGSLVNMEVKYTAAGVFTMKATIKTTAGKTYNYSYTKTISSKPSQITLFFVNEGSYIDGTTLDAIETPVITPLKASGAIYNLAGQMVDESYKGVVIRNGRKYIQK